MCRILFLFHFTCTNDAARGKKRPRICCCCCWEKFCWLMDKTQQCPATEETLNFWNANDDGRRFVALLLLLLLKSADSRELCKRASKRKTIRWSRRWRVCVCVCVCVLLESAVKYFDMGYVSALWTALDILFAVRRIHGHFFFDRTTGCGVFYLDLFLFSNIFRYESRRYSFSIILFSNSPDAQAARKLNVQHTMIVIRANRIEHVRNVNIFSRISKGRDETSFYLCHEINDSGSVCGL